MFESINEAYKKAKHELEDNQFILESVLGVEEVIPGSEEEMDDTVDVDSVPADVYKKIDQSIDNMINNGEYDDTEIDEMVDDDIDDEEIDIVITEAAGSWLNEGNDCECEKKDKDDDDSDDDEEEEDEDEEDMEDLDESATVL